VTLSQILGHKNRVSVVTYNFLSVDAQKPGFSVCHIVDRCIGIVQTINSQQSTANSQQPTANSQQSTVNSQQSTSPDGATGIDINP